MFTEQQIAVDPILKFFSYEHLPDRPGFRDVARNFADMALWIVNTLPRNAERTVALRKLLEAKDAAVRTSIP